jgi:hypothetical protein
VTVPPGGTVASGEPLTPFAGSSIGSAAAPAEIAPTAMSDRSNCSLARFFQVMSTFTDDVEATPGGVAGSCSGAVTMTVRASR